MTGKKKRKKFFTNSLYSLRRKHRSLQAWNSRQTVIPVYWCLCLIIDLIQCNRIFFFFLPHPVFLSSIQNTRTWNSKKWSASSSVYLLFPSPTWSPPCFYTTLKNHLRSVLITSDRFAEIYHHTADGPTIYLLRSYDG